MKNDTTGAKHVQRVHAEDGMSAIRWFRMTTEYFVGVALVLAQLALGGRAVAIAETLDR